MTPSTETNEQGADGLGVLHGRLDHHYLSLRQQRDAFGSGIPVFALEHGLSEAELALLRAEVLGAVRRRHLPRDSWLPFVVYAAEVGYEYCGDEYWQTFEADTPGWADHGDRHYVRRKFREFKDRFGGAEPTGVWARQFSIICWPITHAILPTDLQRHLARLLFEYRRALTAELLADPDELGRRLAARAWQASSRFQNFAQNTSLLGQVATALLVGDDEESPYLLGSTLRRIVADLSEEREARRWLRDAKSSASRVRTHGFRPPDRAAGARSPRANVARLPTATDPSLYLRRGQGGWSVFVELPDLSVLAERLPNVHAELGRLRVRFAGVAGPPLARGRLLYPGQRHRLTDWPSLGTALVQLENGSDAVNGLLADQCVLSPGPAWLFRVREPGVATEVRGKFVRPGHTYVLLSVGEISGDLPAWITRAEAATSGVFAYSVDVPPVLEPDDLTALRHVGVGSIADVEVRPAGLVAATWDGEGTAEWMAGEDPIIGISSGRALSQCIFTLDGEPSIVAWPTDDAELFVQLNDLDVGPHDVHVALLPTAVDEPIAEGALTVLMRTPQTRPLGGTVREGLMILANPVNPTLGEVWDGSAALQVVGPSGVRVRLDLVLADRSMRPRVARRLSAVLPLDTTDWLHLLDSQFRRADEVQRSYEGSEAFVVTVSHGDLGAVSLRCEREFSPLRWAFGRDREGPSVRLVDNTDGLVPDIQRYEFAEPANPVAAELDAAGALRWRPGGLVTASAGSNRVSVILPPEVRNFADLRSVQPRVETGSRSLTELLKLIEISNAWATAALPADPFASTRRLSVLRAVASRLAGLVGGHRWEQLEESTVRGAAHSIADLAAVIGEQGYQQTLATELIDRVDALRPMDPAERADVLADVMARNAQPAGVRGNDQSLAEFLLRLASEPSSLTSWPTDDLRSKLELILTSPVLLRAARFVVLVTAGADDEDFGTAYEGWSWE